MQEDDDRHLGGAAGLAAAAAAAAGALDALKVWLAAMKAVTESATAGVTRPCFCKTARMNDSLKAACSSKPCMQ